jgi:dihydrofolate reductase
MHIPKKENPTMRKVILSVALSLDGFIDGSNGEYDWCPPPSEKEMKEFMDDIDIIFMGRKSYEMAGTSMFPDKQCYVFSNTLNKVKGNGKIIGKDFATAVAEIKQQSGKNIWLYGGASLTTDFINHQLVDEMWLGLVPIVLGSGKPLFQNITNRQLFKADTAFVSKGYFSLKLKKSNK